jgi:hypothetical protein
MTGHVEIGEPEPVPTVQAGQRSCQLIVCSTCGDPWHPVIRSAWSEAVVAGFEMVRVFCRECSGKRQRAHLGTVWASSVGALLEMELVAPPRVVPDDKALPRLARQLPGWDKRGDPNAPQRVLALDEPWPDDDPLPFVVYCRHHGMRVATFGELRAKYRQVFDGGRTKNLGI